MFLTLTGTGEGGMQLLLSYFDIPTLILLVLLSVAMVLLSGKKNMERF